MRTIPAAALLAYSLFVSFGRRCAVAQTLCDLSACDCVDNVARCSGQLEEVDVDYVLGDDNRVDKLIVPDSMCDAAGPYLDTLGTGTVLECIDERRPTTATLRTPPPLFSEFELWHRTRTTPSRTRIRTGSTSTRTSGTSKRLAPFTRPTTVPLRVQKLQQAPVRQADGARSDTNTVEYNGITPAMFISTVLLGVCISTALLICTIFHWVRSKKFQHELERINLTIIGKIEHLPESTLAHRTNAATVSHSITLGSGNNGGDVGTTPALDGGDARHPFAPTDMLPSTSAARARTPRSTSPGAKYEEIEIQECHSISPKVHKAVIHGVPAKHSSYV